MNIQIRAGILFNLAVDDVKKIKDKVMRDILYHNKVLQIFTFYSYYYYLLDQYKPDDCGILEESGYAKILFNNYHDKFIQLFIDKGFLIEQIEYMSSMLLNVISLTDIMKKYIIYNDWKSSCDSKGILYEKIAIKTLNGLGIEIADAKSSSVVISDFIEIHGKPDGVIVSSPGNIYKPGTLIEIKYKQNNNSNSKFHHRDIMQIAAYSKIFNSDVLYVRVYDNYSVECDLYTTAELNIKFNSRLSHVIKNCGKIKKYITSDDDILRQKLIAISCG